MDTCDSIKIPADRHGSVYVKAPHLKPFRSNYDMGIPLFFPALETLAALEFLPLPPTIADRLESSLEKVQFTWSGSVLTDIRDVKYRHDKLKETINKLRPGRSWYPSRADYHRYDGYKFVDSLLLKCLRPEDFSFEQRLSAFDMLASKILEELEEEYYHANAGPYHDYKYNPPVSFVNARYTLKEWNSSVRKRVEDRIGDLVSAQRLMRDMTGCDWSPFSCFFGTDVERLAQLKSATLKAELDVSWQLLKKEYDNFLDALSRGTQMGAMRENSMCLESVLVGKFKISIAIRDIGQGAKIAKGVSETVRGVTSDVKDTVDLVKDIGKGIAKLFGG